MSRRDFRCPYCGAGCLADDEAQTIGHAHPVCAEFAAKNARADRVQRVIGDDAIEAMLAEQREEVRKNRN